MMIGCYRKGDAIDPEIYASAAVAVLTRYPVDVVMAVTEPATGLPSTLKWLPSIAEITEACNERTNVRESRIDTTGRIESQLHERKRLDEFYALAPTAERVAHVARLRAEGRLKFG